MEQQLDFEIDLSEGLKDKESAKEVVKKVQNAIDQLVSANNRASESAKKSLELVAEYEKQIDLLVKANTDLSDALKNIHIMLNSKRELFKHDEAMAKFMEKLATWTLSSSAIKAGVLSHKEKENETNQS